MKKLWGRLYAGTRNNRKIRILRTMFPKYWYVWYCLLELAIEVDDGGLVYVSRGRPFKLKELANEVGIKNPEVLGKILQAMEELGIIKKTEEGILLVGWGARQAETNHNHGRGRTKAEASATTAVKPPTSEPQAVSPQVPHQKASATTAVKPPTSEPQAVSPQVPHQDPPNPKSSGYSEDFLSFWGVYPRKVGKEEAYRRWCALKKTKKLPSISELLAAVNWQARQEDWLKDGGKFIPHPATWLNAGRWADEPPSPSRPPSNGRIREDCYYCGPGVEGRIGTNGIWLCHACFENGPTMPSNGNGKAELDELIRGIGEM